MEINKGIETFDDRMDVTRTNPDRKPFGGKGTDQFHLGSEYDVKAADAPPVTEPPKVDPPAPKVTHKLPDGTVIEGATVEELATNIEKHFSKQPAPPQTQEDFEDKPLYTPREFKPKDLSVQEMADILNVMKENPQKAFRMLHEAEYGAAPEVVREVLNSEEQRKLGESRGSEGMKFIEANDNYNPTTKNGKKLTDFLHEKGKPITKKNLQIAFGKLLEAGDKGLLKAEVPAKVAQPVDDGLVDSPPPPTIVPTNMGLPEAPPAGTVDVAKFRAMSLADQKKVFTDMRRR